MTLTELQQAVYTITNRPDRVAQTLLAVQAATLKAHQADYYWKDLLETGVVFDAPLYLQSLDYRALLPRFRSTKYLRKSDVSGAAGRMLTLRVPETVFNDYGQEDTDVYYTAGSVIQVKSSTALQYIILGVYLNPDIAVATYNSWIALDHPFAIIYEAAAQVFKQIGKTQEFAVYTAMAQQAQNSIGVSNIVGNGY